MAALSKVLKVFIIDIWNEQYRYVKVCAGFQVKKKVSETRKKYFLFFPFIHDKDTGNKLFFLWGIIFFLPTLA